MIKLLPIEDKGFTEFSVCDVGYESCPCGYKFGPHIRNYYLIHFVISGEGKFTNPHEEYKVKGGEAFLIKNRDMTVYQADEKNPWEYIWFGFRGTLSSKFDEMPDVFAYDATIVDEIKEAFSMESGKEELLTGIAFKLYARIFGDKIKNDYPNKVVTYINSHYMEDISIAEMANNLGLDRKYLARIFKESHGESMQECLINKRLHEAKKLLKLGYNVEECAYMVGYKDPFGFSKAFKKKYGESPIKLKMKI